MFLTIIFHIILGLSLVVPLVGIGLVLDFTRKKRWKNPSAPHTFMVLHGNFGVGKTELIQHIRLKYSREIAIISRYTPWEPMHDKKQSETDLKFISQKHFDLLKRNKNFHSYQSGSKNYGFFYEDIDRVFSSYAHSLFIVQDDEVRKILQNKYSAYPSVKSVFLESTNFCATPLKGYSPNEDDVHHEMEVLLSRLHKLISLNSLYSNSSGLSRLIRLNSLGILSGYILKKQDRIGKKMLKRICNGAAIDINSTPLQKRI